MSGTLGPLHSEFFNFAYPIATPLTVIIRMARLECKFRLSICVSKLIDKNFATTNNALSRLCREYETKNQPCSFIVILYECEINKDVTCKQI